VLPGTPAEYELGKFATIPTELPSLDLVQLSLPPATAASLVLAQAPGAGRVREVRDVQGLLIREERDARARRYAYDQGGNLRWRIDFDGAKTEWAHASDDHRVSKTDPNGYVTLLDYTKESELAAVTDAKHTRTVFPRDTRSQVAGVSRANVWKERYRRDGAGRLIDKTAANGASLYTIKRGPQGEVLERLFASGGFERFVYDGALRVVGAETPAGEQSFAYDYNGKRIADLRDGKGVRSRFLDGNLVEHRVLDSFVTRYRYLETPHAREAVITDPTGREHRLRDHRFGVVTRELASGRRETVQYHPDGHCLGKVVETVKGAKAAAVASVPAAPSWTRRYEYSGEGYLLARHDSARGPTRYALDAAHRLIGEELPTGHKRVFEHDAAGNVLDHAGRLATYVSPARGAVLPRMTCRAHASMHENAGCRVG
jgi:YD repeat-containing protein